VDSDEALGFIDGRLLAMIFAMRRWARAGGIRRGGDDRRHGATDGRDVAVRLILAVYFLGSC
jgi:hypothetical protein